MPHSHPVSRGSRPRRSLARLVAAVLPLALAAPLAFAFPAAALQIAQAPHGHSGTHRHHGAPAPASTLPAPAERVFRTGDLVITAPWARATPGGARVAGGYLRITNTGKEPETLTGGTAVFAGRLELHDMAVTDGIMRMRELPSGLTIAPGETVELKPGGTHVMFMDLKQPLKEGENWKGTLTFARAGTIEVEFAVGGIAAKAGGAGEHKH